MLVAKPRPLNVGKSLLYHKFKAMHAISLGEQEIILNTIVGGEWITSLSKCLQLI
jgi:hypothetical protein